MKMFLQWFEIYLQFYFGIFLEPRSAEGDGSDILCTYDVHNIMDGRLAETIPKLSLFRFNFSFVGLRSLSNQNEK